MSSGLDTQLLERIAASPKKACHALATVGPELVLAAVRRGRLAPLMDVLEDARKQRLTFYRDSLDLLLDDQLEAAVFPSLVQGAGGTIHHPDFVRLVIREQGLDGAKGSLSRCVGLDLDREALAVLGTPARVIELLETPLLAQGMTEDEARVLFGDEFHQVERVERDLVHRTWTYYTSLGTQDGDIICELSFDQGVLIGWTDRQELVGADLGPRRLAQGGDVPASAKGFDLAAVAVTVVAMAETGVSEEVIRTYLAEVVPAIQRRKPTWPFNELESLAPLGEVQRTQRITLDEGRERLEHLHARFSGYNPDLLVVPSDVFIDRALQVLEAADAITERVPVRRAVLLGILLGVASLALGLVAIRCESEHQAGPPDDLPAMIDRVE